MAAPLSKLREYCVLKKEIVERENKLIFGDYSWPKDEKTSLLKSNKSGPAKEYYTLDCLLYFFKNQDLMHVVYAKKAIETKLQVVCSSHRTDILKYLNGDIDNCMCMDEVLYPSVKEVKECRSMGKSQLVKKPQPSVYQNPKPLQTSLQNSCDKNISQLANITYYVEDAYYTRSEAFWVKMTKTNPSKSAIKKAKMQKKKERREAKNRQESENKMNVLNVKTEPESDFTTVKTKNISRNVKPIKTENKSNHGLPLRVNKGPEDITSVTGFNDGTTFQIKRDTGNATTTESEKEGQDVATIKVNNKPGSITIKTEKEFDDVTVIKVERKNENVTIIEIEDETMIDIDKFEDDGAESTTTTTESEEDQDVATTKIEKKPGNITIKTEGESDDDENISRNVKPIQSETKSDHGLPLRVNKGLEDITSVTGFNYGTTFQIKSEQGNATTTKSEKEGQNDATIKVNNKPGNITIKTEKEFDDVKIIKVERKDENVTIIEIEDETMIDIDKFEDDGDNDETIDVMANPLSKLREYNITKKKIMEYGNKFIFGEYSWPIKFRTPLIRFRSDTKIEYYTLECLVFFLKNNHRPHVEYVKIAKMVNKQAVKRKDREKILMYLNGQIEDSPFMDINEYLSTPKKSRGIKKRKLGNKPCRKKVKMFKNRNHPNTDAYCPKFLAEDTTLPEIKGRKRIGCTSNNYGPGAKSYRSTHYYNCDPRPRTTSKEFQNLVKTDNDTDDVTIKTKHESGHETIKTKNERLTITMGTGYHSSNVLSGTVKAESKSVKVTIKEDNTFRNAPNLK